MREKEQGGTGGRERDQPSLARQSPRPSAPASSVCLAPSLCVRRLLCPAVSSGVVLAQHLLSETLPPPSSDRTASTRTPDWSDDRRPRFSQPPWRVGEGRDHAQLRRDRRRGGVSATHSYALDLCSCLVS